MRCGPMLSFLKYLFILFLVVCGTAAGGYFYVTGKLEAISSAPVRAGSGVFRVAPGATPLGVMDELNGDPEDRFFYRLWFRLHPEYSSLKAGTYSLEKAVRIQDAFEILCSGKELAYYFPVVEGTRYEQILSRMAADSNIKMDLEPDKIPDFFTLNSKDPEGLLFPDSYRFTAGDTASSILRRSYGDLESYLKTEWDHRDPDLPLKDAYEALILASIVEKETSGAGEHATVAAVFINRLRQNMKLQSDPTTIYGVKDRYDGKIHRRDLDDVNPYNTYVIAGLPPTPIAVASRKSIQAVLHPEKVNYLYFVADGNGGHTFSTTLAEHNRAVASYLKVLRERKKQRAANASSAAEGNPAAASASDPAGVPEASGDTGAENAPDALPDGGAVSAAGKGSSPRSASASPRTHAAGSRRGTHRASSSGSRHRSATRGGGRKKR